MGTYALGIDLGTTFVGAAIVRADLAEIVPLGNRAAVVPSLVYFGEQGEFRIGEAALARAVTAPGRVAREFKRRFGDSTPFVLGGTTWSSEALMARLLRWTVDTVTEREGAAPDRIALTHPANWGPFKLDLLTQAVRLAEVKVDRYLSEPEAAAFAYAAAERLPLGDTVAVYDLGGGTFDATVLRAGEHGFEILGNPEGIERLGGIDVDQIVLAHVAEALDGALDRLDPDAPTTLALLARLRQDCVDAKEQLSFDTEATIPVTLPGMQTEVRLTRAELERKIEAPLHDTVKALRRTLASASVEPADLRAVLLVGGASRMPIVADLVSQELGRPVALDAHPKHAVAIGAALAARGAPVATVPMNGPTPVPVTVPVTGAAPAAPPMARPTAPLAARPASSPAVPPPAAPVDEPAAPPAPPAGRHSRALVGAIGGLAVAVLVLAGVFVFRSDSSEATAFPIQNPSGATAPTGRVDCPQGTAAVCISDLRVDGGKVVADFESNVQLADPVDGAFAASTVHPLFFWDTQGPAKGRHWGSGSPFTGSTRAGFQGFTAADVPSGATLCVVLIDNEGTWVPGTGNCVALG